jgi:ethanolamine transporter EutH
MTLRYVKGYLLQFATMFAICFGALTSFLLVGYTLVPFIMWDFSLFYNEQWVSFSFFMFRVILIITTVVSIFYCLDSNTKRLIRKYAEEGNEK